LEISCGRWRCPKPAGLRRALYRIRAVLPIMRKQGSVHLIDVMSGIAFMPMAYQTMYAAT
jgi:short-subunit dehydrogenase